MNKWEGDTKTENVLPWFERCTMTFGKWTTFFCMPAYKFVQERVIYWFCHSETSKVKDNCHRWFQNNVGATVVKAIILSVPRAWYLQMLNKQKIAHSHFKCIAKLVMSWWVVESILSHLYHFLSSFCLFLLSISLSVDFYFVIPIRYAYEMCFGCFLFFLLLILFVSFAD